MEYKDYYKIMGLERKASQDEIKRAYRKLARKYHPDVSKETDAEAKFKELGEAYEVLKDAEKRAAYDELGSNWRSGQDFRPPPDWETNFNFKNQSYTETDAGDFSDFFEQLFGQHPGFASTRRGRGSHTRGEDSYAKIHVDLEDSFQGQTRSVSFNAPVVDEKGKVHVRQKTLNIKIPKGIKPGQHIRLSGQGGQGVGDAPSGDLLLEVAFNKHDFFRLTGADVYLDLPVAPWEAALGAKIKVPTPNGVMELKVPPGSKQGSKFKLAGRGLPSKNPSDFYVILQIALPPASTEKAIQAYEKMQEEFDFNPRHSLGV